MSLRPDPDNFDAAVRLAAFAFASRLRPVAGAALESEVRPVRVDAGVMVVARGERPESVLLVESGDLRVYSDAPDGREIVLYHVAAGEACALSLCAALSGTPYPAAAASVTAVRALVVPARVFRWLHGTEPAVQQFVIDLLGRRMSAAVAMITELAFDRLDRRLARFLAGRAAPGPSGMPRIAMTHAAIAGELGTAREVVTRALETFASRGWVALGRGRIAVLDRRSLADHAAHAGGGRDAADRWGSRDASGEPTIRRSREP